MRPPPPIEPIDLRPDDSPAQTSMRRAAVRSGKSSPIVPSQTQQTQLEASPGATPDDPIVVLDSGLGGLTVVKSLRRALPHERFIYFGDTARLPYGNKTPATVTAFVRQIIQYLRPHRPKHVVIACNTATALALPALRTAFPDLSISGVVEPGAKAAVEAAGSRQWPTIGILATEATIRSKAYEHAIHRRRQHARLLLRPAPLLVPIIEEGRTCEDPIARLALKQYLKPLIERSANVVVLGCTHYPILREAIVKLLPPDVVVIDSADRCADDVAARLRARQLLRWPCEAAGPVDALTCYVTDNSPRFGALASHFLGVAVSEPALVSLEALNAAERELATTTPALAAG